MTWQKYLEKCGTREEVVEVTALVVTMTAGVAITRTATAETTGGSEDKAVTAKKATAGTATAMTTTADDEDHRAARMTETAKLVKTAKMTMVA